MTPEMLTEHELRQMLDTALDVVVLCDEHGVFSWVSPSADCALGRPHHELIGSDAAELVHPDDLGRVLGAVHDAFASPGTVVAVDAFRFRGGDGTDRWLSGRWRTVTGDGLGGRGVVAVLRDVAELVHARRVAEADRAELRATLDSLLDPHVVLDPIRDGETGRVVDVFVREANPAVTAGSDLSPESLIGARLSLMFPPHAAEITIGLCAWILGTGKPLVLDDYEYVRGPDEAEPRRYDVRATRFGDAVSITWRDVTERALSRRHLAESEARYRRLAENASDIVFETTPEGVITWVSPSVERVLGWPVAHLDGTSVFEFVDPTDQQQVETWRDEANAGGELEFGEVRVRAHDGELHWMSFRAQPLLDPDGEVYRTVVTLRHVDAEVAERRAAATLATVSAILVRADDEHELLHDVCEAAVCDGGYLFAWYGRPLDDAERTVQVEAHAEAHAGYLEGIRVSWGDGPFGKGPSGRAIRARDVVIVDDFETNPDYAPWRTAARRHGFRSSIAVPVEIDGRVDGCLMVYAAERHAFGGREVAVLGNLAAELGYGLERLRDRNRLDGALRNAVDLLAATVESRDPYTAGHQGQVAILAVEIGRELGFGRRRLDGLSYAANVHDLGKVAVPIAVLDKHGRLTDEEFAMVRRHPAVGAEIARRFDWPWPIVEVIEQHHERWDGTGYPRGLAGDEIVLDARVVAVADAFEAIAAARPYRKALGYEEARRIIEEECGSHFDPQVVEAFLRVLDAGFTFPRLHHT
jgi:PAS domain S-box-containing protein